MFLKEVSSAQQGCIYQVKLWILLEFKMFSMQISVKLNLFLWSKLNFQHHYSSLQNHYNMMICCSRNIYDYYQSWKQLCCPIFLWKLWYILFFRILWQIESSKEQCLFETEIFCNIINVTFDQFNASLLNKSINLSPNLWTAYACVLGMGRFPDSLGASAKEVNNAMYWFKKCASDTSWHLYRDASFFSYLHR